MATVKISSQNRTARTRSSDASAQQAKGWAKAPSLENATKDHPIKRGQAGASVEQLQRELNQRGFKLDEDGKFGPRTEEAVRKFQAQNGAKVDGMVGPETLGAMQRGASVESAGDTAARTQAERTVGNTDGPRAPTSTDGAPADGGVRAGELARDNPNPGVQTRGPQGEVTDVGNGSVARGDLGQATFPNGTTVTGPSGTAYATDDAVGAHGNLLHAENEDASITVGDVGVHAGNDGVEAHATGIESSIGDNSIVGAGSKIGDAGGEITYSASEQEGRIGAGYRANIAEVNARVGQTSSASTDDYVQEARISAGAPSGGAFVSWNDHDGDGARNYKLEVDVPLPFGLGAGMTVETESPVKDGLALAASLNPMTAVPAGAYRLGRALKFW